MDTLQQYVADCAHLQTDLDGFISDLELSDGGRRIRYAVDHSETYAYLFWGMQTSDSRAATRSEMSLFGDDSDQISTVLERAALSRLFEGNRDPLVLLEPYELELISSIDRYRAKSAIELARAFAGGRTLASLRGRGDYSYVRSVAAKVERGEAELTAREIDRILDFFQTKAPDVLLLVDGNPAKVARRARGILHPNRLEIRPGPDDAELTPDRETVDRWYRILRANRHESDGNSYLDAVAAALVMSANARNDERWRIVTRSKHMHRMRDVEGELERWEAVGGWPLRHPRCLALMSAQPDLDHSEVLRLRSLSQTLWAVTEAARRMTASTDTDSPAQSEILQRVEAIKQESRNRLNLASSMDAMGTDSALGGEETTRDASKALALLRIVWDSDRLRQTMRERIDELTRSVIWKQQSLGLGLVGAQLEDRRLPRSLEVVDVTHISQFGRHSIATAALDHLPYTLQFYSDLARQLFDSLQKKRASWLDMLRALDEAALRDSDDPQVRFEGVLLVAYMLAILGEWGLAETYCSIATEESGDSAKMHEGFFLHAVCLRLNDAKATPDRFRIALGLLTMAAEQEPRSSGDPDFEDPRYLKEKAALIFSWRERWREGSSDWVDDAGCPPSDEAVGLCMRALELTEGSRERPHRELRLQLLNNLSYHYLLESYFLSGSSKETREAARAHLRRLEKEQSSIAERQELWPADFLDTIGWGRWVLCKGRMSTAARQESLRLLDFALGKLSSDDSRRRVFRHHRAQIEQAGSQISASG